MYEKEIVEILKSEEIVEPETIRRIMPEASDTEIDKLMALVSLYKTMHFFENFYIFENIVLALNGVKPDFAVLQGSSPEQMWYAIETAHKLYPTREFAPEVLKYIEYMFNKYGVYVYPPYLDMMNPYYAAAYKLATEGPYPIGDATTEEIQAGKLMAILHYINEKNK
jgi:hypothetical protein